MTKTVTYRLASSGLVHTPGIVRWAINGYAFPKDRKAMRAVLTEGWGIPELAADDLLAQHVPYTLDGDTVVFTTEAELEVAS